MSKEYIQKLAGDEKHIRHVVLEIVASYLESHTDEIIEDSQDNLPLDENEEPDDELMALFSTPLEKGVEKLAKELQQQADAMSKTCMCYWLDDERVYPEVRTILKQLPLPNSTAFCRDDDEGYRLEVSGELIFEHLGPDEAIEATRQYVEAYKFPSPPPDGKEGFN